MLNASRKQGCPQANCCGAVQMRGSTAVCTDANAIDAAQKLRDFATRVYIVLRAIASCAQQPWIGAWSQNIY